MNEFIIYILIGLALGIIVFPIGLFIFIKIKNTFERREIKKLIKQEKFLVPIDPKDYDVKAWEGKKYGNINTEETKRDLQRLNDKIFNKAIKEEIERQEEKKEESEEKIKFLENVRAFIEKAKAKGLSNQDIEKIFREKNYSEELIKEIFNI